MPFIALNLPYVCMSLLNAFFYYFSIIFLFKALKIIVSTKLTVIFSLAWASYLIAYQNIPFIHTETFTYLLITLLLYFVLKAFKPSNSEKAKKYLFLSGFFFGYIALTKIIFGYVILFMLAGSFLLWISKRSDLYYRKILIITTTAFITITPYLIYTYSLTGRVFYLGMQNDSMFWMTTPFEEEYGDWTQNLQKNPPEAANYNIYGADSVLRANHQEDFDEINKYTGIERDDALLQLGIRNIKSHPLKYAQNIVYNMGRLVFHYPFSQAIQKPRTLLILPINGILFTLIIFSLIPTIINWRKVPVAIEISFNIYFSLFGS